MGNSFAMVPPAGTSGTSGTSGTGGKYTIETLAAGGCKFLSGEGFPKQEIGYCCDTYLDLDNGVIWKKESLDGTVDEGLYEFNIGWIATKMGNINSDSTYINTTSINIFSGCETSSTFLFPRDEFEIIFDKPLVIRGMSTEAENYYCTAAVPKYSHVGTSSAGELQNLWNTIGVFGGGTAGLPVISCDITNHGKTILVGGQYHGVYMTIDGAKTWKQILPYGIWQSVAISQDGSTIVVIDTAGGQDDVLVKENFDYATVPSVPTTAGWTLLDTGTSSFVSGTVDISSSGKYVIVGGDNISYYSESPFSSVNTISVATNGEGQKAAIGQNDDSSGFTAIIGGAGGAVFKTIDSGSTWHQVGTPGQANHPNANLEHLDIDAGGSKILCCYAKQVFGCDLGSDSGTSGTWTAWGDVGTNFSTTCQVKFETCTISTDGEFILTADEGDNGTPGWFGASQDWGTTWFMLGTNAGNNHELKFDKTGDKTVVLVEHGDTEINETKLLTWPSGASTSSNVIREFYNETDNVWETSDDMTSGTSLNCYNRAYSKVRYRSGSSGLYNFNHEEFYVYACEECVWQVQHTCKNQCCPPTDCYSVIDWAKTSATGGTSYNPSSNGGTVDDNVVSLAADNTEGDYQIIYGSENCYYKINISGSWNGNPAQNDQGYDFTAGTTSDKLYVGYLVRDVDNSSLTTSWITGSIEAAGSGDVIEFDKDYILTTSGNVYIIPYAGTSSTGSMEEGQCVPSTNATSFSDFSLSLTVQRCPKSSYFLRIPLDTVDTINGYVYHNVPNGEGYRTPPSITSGLIFPGFYSVYTRVSVSETTGDGTQAETDIAQTLSVNGTVIDTSPALHIVNTSLQGSIIVEESSPDCDGRNITITTYLPNGATSSVLSGSYCHVRYIGENMGTTCKI